MKKRFLALATALVMLIGLLPATTLTVTAVEPETPAYVDLSSAGLGSFVLSNNNHTATLTNSSTTVGTLGGTLVDFF